MAADHEAHADVVAALRERAAEVGGIVLGPPELGWAFARYDLHPIEHKWNESRPAGIGAIATREGFAKPGWSDSCTFSEVEPIPMSSFVSNRFRGRGKLWEVGARLDPAQPSGDEAPRALFAPFVRAGQPGATRGERIVRATKSEQLLPAS